MRSIMEKDDARRKESAILDEIERIGIRAETEGRELVKEEVARIQSLSKQFDVCEETLHPKKGA